MVSINPQESPLHSLSPSSTATTTNNHNINNNNMVVVVRRRQRGMISRHTPLSDSSAHITVVPDGCSLQDGKSPSTSSLRGGNSNHKHKHHNPSSSVCFAGDYGSPDQVYPAPPPLTLNERRESFYTVRFDGGSSGSRTSFSVMVASPVGGTSGPGGTEKLRDGQRGCCDIRSTSSTSSQQKFLTATTKTMLVYRPSVRLVLMPTSFRFVHFIVFYYTYTYLSV
jgi:hypothetical protein